MSLPSSCCEPCPSVQTVDIPGIEGQPGLDGADGVNGADAFTFTTDDFLLPAVSGTVVVEVAATAWMVIGQKVFVQGSGMMEVVSIVDGTHVELENLGYVDNVAPGTNVVSGSGVSPGGTQPSVAGFAASGANSDITSLTGLTTPLPINEGGTGATTATGARLDFGLSVVSNTADVVANAADTYLTGSGLLVPVAGLKVGSLFRWRLFMTKTAAGVATPVWNIRIGLAGTVADTARIVFTGPAQTGAADTGSVIIEGVLRSIGGAGVLAAGLRLSHNLATTGFANIGSPVLQVVSAGFDTTPANLIVGLSVDPGVAGVWSHQQVRGELWLNN